ncbi:MAG: hypothetical protein HGA19_04265 [Oscillochloris sp.]|nr:hypothetical protein [Oscillochloris sp.]
MSETNPTPEDQREPTLPAPRWRVALAAALPYISTAVAAVLCSLLIQATLRPSVPISPIQQTTIVAVGTATAQLSPTSEIGETSAAVAPSTIPADESVIRLEVLDLEAEDRHLWSALYLLRAASQIDDAVVTLQSNDLDAVDRTLLNARRSLDRAYTFSAEQEKGPIDTFRLQISQIRDDLRVRPEGLDHRLRQIRQLILSLVDEGGA